MEPVLLTPEQAAEALQISRSTVYELMRRGQEHGGIASVRIGRCRRIPVKAVHEFVTRQRAEEAS